MGNLFTKKQAKEFAKLSKEDRQKFLELAFSQAVDNALRKHIPLAMVSGMRLRSDALYEKYVRKLDELCVDTTEWNEMVEKMLSEIRTDYLSNRKEERKSED